MSTQKSAATLGGATAHEEKETEAALEGNLITCASGVKPNSGTVLNGLA